MTAPEAVLFAAALRHYRERELDRAERDCQAILVRAPDHAPCLNLLAQMAWDRGDHEQARHLVDRAIALAPDEPEYRLALGNILFALKRFPEAAAACERALALKPDYPEAHNALGNAQLAMGSAEQALASYRAALALSPVFASPINNMGNALVALGRYEEALAAHRRALALLPDSVPVIGSLANALQKLDRFAEAIAYYEKVIALEPGHAQTYSNLGAAQHALKHHAEAVESCRKAIELMPDLADAHLNLGNALEALDRFEEAMASYARARALQPDNAEVHGNMAHALVENGHLDQAAEALHQAIALAPGRPKFYLYLAELRPTPASSPLLQAMEDLAAGADRMADEDRIDIHFALGKAYADIGEHERSLRHLLAGNGLKRRHTVYDEALALRQMDQIRAAFPAPVVEAWRGLGDPSPLPVFILGMPRSGSTLVEQILAAHPEVHAAGEVSWLEDCLAEILAPPGIYAMPDAVAGHADLPRRVARRYLARMSARAPQAARVTDKMPGNFKYAAHIHLALPNARIIHTCRDPVDTCLSCYGKLFAGGMNFSYDLSELGRYYRAYDRLMRHWREVLPAGAILDVRYEELLSDFEAQCRRIVAFCGLSWNDRCLSFHEAQRTIHTASAPQVRRPLFSTSAGRRRHYGAEALRPLLDALGDAGTPGGHAPRSG